MEHDKTPRFRCGRFHDEHKGFDLHTKQCKECKWSLEKMCNRCNKFTSYSNFAKHRCGGGVVETQPRKLRFVCLGSGWRLDPHDCGRFGVVPMGQYRDPLPNGFPTDLFRQIPVLDPSGDSTGIDAYDAIWGYIGMDTKNYELVRSFRTLDELMSAVKSRSLPEGLDFLAMGEWIHPMIYETESRKMVEEALHTLRNLEIDAKLRIFPPLDYVWFFAQKVLYCSHLGQWIDKSLNARPIPMIVVPSGHFWKQQMQEFAASHSSKSLMFKRDLSDGKKHAIPMEVSSLTGLPGRSEFRWMAQPFLTEFTDFPEMRMYVLRGKCSFGVMTKFDANDCITMTATAPGRRNWEEKYGGAEAASIAEKVVEIVSQDHAGAKFFMRVDLIRRRTRDAGGVGGVGGVGDFGWWINELEFFGNAYLLLEAFDNATDLLEDMVEMTKHWIRSMIRN